MDACIPIDFFAAEEITVACESNFNYTRNFWEVKFTGSTL